jgi:hypothetical protein
MFEKKVKEENTQVAIPLPEVPQKPPLTTAILDELYHRKAILTIDPEYRNIPAVIFMKALESIGAEPININQKWFVYRVGVLQGFRWDFRSYFSINRMIAFEYAFPLPYEAILKLQELDYKLRKDLEKDFNFDGIADISIIAPDQRLGRQLAPAIVADPILLAEVRFNGKLYRYQICAWNIKEDLKFDEGESNG